MMTLLQDKSRLEPIQTRRSCRAPYATIKKRGVSWLQYLGLGLNGCLADDMGLGKSAQVIVRLVNEKESMQSVPPTLLMRPPQLWGTGLMPNLPHLQAMVHHGSDRIKQSAEFKQASRKHDVVITSFTLARKDENS